MGDCFIYNNSAWRLNYCVGGEVTTMFHLDRPMFLLGYLASQSRVYLIDREFGVVAYTLLLTLIEYKTLIIRGDLEGAAKTLPNVPKVDRTLSYVAVLFAVLTKSMSTLTQRMSSHSNSMQRSQRLQRCAQSSLLIWHTAWKPVTGDGGSMFRLE